jgi:SAM-dependent methyltransferase
MADVFPIPPPELRFMGKSDDEFLRVGEALVDDLEELVGLDFDDSILDVGCGYGRIAYALWNRGHRGRYLGFDVLPRHIQWCQENMTPASDGMYEFLHLDVNNSRYNKEGRLEGSRLTFDFGFRPDTVVATSVFTHMLPDDIDNYLQEIGRILAPGGHVLATFFLINPSQMAWEAKGQSRYALEHRLTSFARFWSTDDPLHVIAYEQEWIVERVRAAGLSVDSILLGSWCGRPGTRVFQDTLILSI